MTATFDAAHAAAARTLRDGGVDTPALDARVLLKSATGLSLEALIAKGREMPSPAQGARFAAYVRRRLSGEPVSRIQGFREFYGRAFLIDPHTLDPRPDSETLVEAALALAGRDEMRGRPLRLLDLGTGSGCLLVTLLAEIPRATGIAVDISPGALMCARRNAQVLGVAERARFLAADWFEGLKGRFDIIVSNPPYIPAAELAALPREVAEHDPPHALDGGADGLDAYRRIADRAGAFLRAEGHLLVEIGPRQRPAVERLLRAAGLVLAGEPIFGDLAGRPRCVHAKRACRQGGRTSHRPKNKLGQRVCSG